MKKLIGVAFAAAALLAGFSEACFDPLTVYYAGIVLNNGEEIHYERLEEVAEEDSFIKECFKQVVNDDVKSGGATESSDSQVVAAKARNKSNESEVELCSYKLRSVFNDEAMVFLGHVAGMFSLFGDVPRLIVYFPVDSNNIPTTEEKAAAVATELQRFTDLGIIGMISRETINRARELLALQQGQYWVAEDSVLAFNMWFGGEGINGVRAVDGVKGTYGVSSCGSGVDYELPVNDLTATVQTGMKKSRMIINPIRSEITACGITIHYSQIATGNEVLKIYDMRARLINKITLEKHSTVTRITAQTGSAMAPGCYLLSIENEGGIVQQGSMTLYR